MADDLNKPNPADDDAEENENASPQNAQQALDDLTVLSDIGDQNMGETRLNVVRPTDVTDTAFGSLATVHQGSEGAPVTRDLGALQTGEAIQTDVTIEQANSQTSIAAVETIELEEAEAVEVTPTQAAAPNLDAKGDLSTDNFVFGNADPEFVELDPPAPPVVEEVLEVAENEVVAEESVEAELVDEADEAPDFGEILIPDPRFEGPIDQAPLVPLGSPQEWDEDRPLPFYNFKPVDPDGGDISVDWSDPPNGQILFDANGNPTYVPDPDFFGQDSFVITLTDDEGNVVSKTIEINIANVNDAPILAESIDAQSGTEGQAFSLDTSAYFTDVDITMGAADSLTFSVAMADGSEVPAWLTIDPETGVLSGSPGDYDAGNLQLKIIATDSEGASIESNGFTLAVADGNVAPVVDGAVDLGAIAEGDGLVISVADLLANASDAQAGDVLSVANPKALDADGNEVGSLTPVVDAEGNVTGYQFTPADENFNGQITLSYDVLDGQGGVTAATAELDVTAVNDAAVVDGAVDLGASAEDNSFTVSVDQLLANASDVDGDVLSVANLRAVDGNGAEVGSFAAVTDAEGNVTGYTFTPNEDFNGDVTFAYDVVDGNGGSTPATATLDITAVDDAAEFDTQGPIELEVTQDGSLTGDVDAVDAEGDVLTYGLLDGDQIVTELETPYGTVTIDPATGAFEFVPNEGTNSLNVGQTLGDSFQVVATDGNTVSEPQLVNVTITGSNDGPVVDMTQLGETGAVEDSAYSLDASALFSDIDQGAVLTYAATLEDGSALPEWMSIDPETGLITGTPENEDVGGLKIVVTATDEHGASVTSAPIDVTVANTNDGPVATGGDLGTVQEDGSVFIPVSSLATDVDAGDVLTFSNLQAVDADGNSMGSFEAVMDGDGNVTGYSFAPNDNFNGELNITYTVSDGTDSTTGSASIEVQNTVDAPTVSVDLANPTVNDGGGVFGGESSLSITIERGDNGNAQGKGEFDVYARNADGEMVNLGHYEVPEGDGATAVQITLPEGFEFAADQDLVIDPTKGTLRVDSIEVNGTTVQAEDGGTIVGGGAIHDDHAQVTSGNLEFDLSTLGGDDSVSYDVNLSVSQPGTGETQTVTVELPEGAVLKQDGVVVEANGDGSYTLDASDLAGLTMTVPEGVAPSIEVSVTSTDQFGNTATTTATDSGTVVDTNDAPEAADHSFTVAEDGSITFSAADLLQGAVDADGNALTVTSVSGDNLPGDLVDNGNGTWTFTPDENFNGDLSLSYTLSDGTTADTGTISIDVTSVNDGPEAADADAITGAEDNSIIITQAQLLEGASDADGDSLSVANLQVDGGSLTDLGNGSWSFTPDADFSGEVNLSYDVVDGNGGSVASEATIEIAGEADTPDLDVDSPVLAASSDGNIEVGVAVGLGSGTNHYSTSGGAGSTDTQFGNGADTLVLRISSTKEGKTADFEVKLDGVVVGTGKTTSGSMQDVQITLNDNYPGEFKDGQKLEIVDKGGPGNLLIDKVTVGGVVIQAETGAKTGGVQFKGDTVKIASGSLSFSLDDNDVTTQVVDRVDYPVNLEISGDADYVGNVTIGGLPSGGTFKYTDADGNAQSVSVGASGQITLTSAQAQAVDANGATLSTNPGVSVGSLSVSRAAETGTSGADQILGSSGGDTLVGNAGDDVIYGDGEVGGGYMYAELDISAGSTDADGSETIAVSLEDLPEGVVVVDEDGNQVGERLGDGSWSLSQDEIAAGGLQLKIPGDGSVGDFDITVKATATDGTDTATTEATISVDLTVDGEGAGGNDKLYGGDGSDTLYGGAGNDYIEGGWDGQADVVSGGGGNDSIVMGSGNDIVDGGAGDDVINAHHGNNTVDGGTGNDSITAYEGNDHIDAGDGNNVVNAGNGNNVVTGGTGNDSVIAYEGNDTVSSGAGNDTIDVGNGTNTVDAGAGNDSVSTGTGSDVVDLGDGNDTVDTGWGGGADTVTGGAGNDSITTNDGNDVIDGGAGVDSISAGSGNDVIEGGAGDDILDGGDGSDSFLFTFGDGNDLIQDGGWSGTDTLDLTNLQIGATIQVGEQSWTVTAENAGNTTIDLGNDADGEVHITVDGQTQTIEFDNLEQIKW